MVAELSPKQAEVQNLNPKCQDQTAIGRTPNDNQYF